MVRYEKRNMEKSVEDKTGWTSGKGEGPLRKKQIKYNGPSKDIKMKDLSNILNMRIFESDFMKKL